MELTQSRSIKTDKTTIGKFLINGEFFCYGLEDVDRGLTSDMSLDEIKSIKVQNKTAIPTGRYQVVKYFSPKHNANVPLLLSVPGFGYVEIHVGNFAGDTDGCLLLGNGMATDMVTDSKTAVDNFYIKFFAALDAGEEVWITYQDAPSE